jgi:hypothetical protein
MKRLNILTYSLFIAFLLIGYNACTMYETPDEVTDSETDDSGISTKIIRKVLWINIDGAVGAVVKDKIPANGTIAKMMKNSKYCWTGLSDKRTLSSEEDEDPVTWATMLTGVIPEKHNINDGSYTANVTYNPADETETVTHYQNIINYISNEDVNKLSLCVTPWANLNNNMLINARSTITSTSDTETRDVVVENIANEDYTFILADFSGMLEAGKNGGFKADNAAYVNALNDIDGYIGEFLTAIDGRKNIYYEDWLIIITSNHGGTSDGHYDGYSDAERNIFGLFYYNHYNEKALNGSKLYGALFDNQKQYKALVFDTLGVNYSLGTGAFSFEVITRLTPEQNGTYSNGSTWAKMIGKGKWGLFRQRTESSFYISSSATLQQSATYNDAQWHHYGFAIDAGSSGRSWRIISDGKLLKSGTYDAPGVSPDSTVLQIGGTTVATSYLVSELRLWKKSLTETEFLQSPDITPTTDLIGYWKFQPTEVVRILGTDTLIFKNQIAGGLNLYYIKTADAEWPSTDNGCIQYSNSLPAYVNAEKITFDNTLIVPQILYWLGISVPSTLDGYQFINLYSLSEEWREDPNAEE